MLDSKQAARFWGKVQKTEGCWLWTGGTQPSGYGWFGIWRGTRQGAHRWAWQLANQQEIPDGAVVMHACDNRLCVNPAHLALGSHADNIRDMHRKERWCDRKGAKHPLAELTEDGARDIKYGGLSAKEAAKKYRVSPSVVFKIRSGARWAHI